MTLQGAEVLDTGFPVIEGMGAELHLGMGTRSQDLMARKLLNSLAWMLGIVGLFGLTASLFISRRIARPLHVLAEQITRYGSGTLDSPNLIGGGSREVRQLQRSFTSMVAARRHTEKESARFKTTLDLTLDCVFMFSAKGLNFFYANRGAMEQVGYTHDELMAMRPFDIKPEFDEKRFRKMIAPMLAGDQSAATFETRHQHKDGTIIPVEIFLQYIDPPGESPRFVAIVRDITERKRTEETLRRSEARLTAAQRIAHLGHWEREIGTDVFYCSDETYRIFGMKPGAFAPTYGKFLERIHPRDRTVLSQALDDAIATNIPCSVEHRILHADGTERVVQEIAEVTRGGDGTPLRVVGTLQDITERKKVERMKDEFISTVSHELRTPLTSIRGSLGLLAGGAAGEFPTQAASLLEIANKNTERLLLLINDILDISKLESGTVKLHLQPVAVGPFLDQIIAANQTFAREHGTTFEFRSRLDDAWVLGDSDRLAQVMNNLMSNAAKFAPADSPVQISAARNGYFIRISVTDHGPGIPAAFQPLLFDKFTQSDSSDTRQVGGTGLGMSIAKALVERHGGSIGFVTEENVGTTFYFDLPAWYEPGLGATPPPEIEDPGNWRNRLLICEDDPDIRHVIGAVLGNQVEVVQASTLRDAARKLREDRFDLLLLDMALPDGCGLDLLNDGASPLPPVVIFSAKEIDRETARCVNAALVKSRISDKDLVDTILRLACQAT